ncbi:LysM peptidoglycan-binding domain-containing protein [Macrococcus equi]|uniref:C40 family peptidase n=1 Tax=Macrococcus equi TaxID=3395462 RepID=UPI0039BE6176
MRKIIMSVIGVSTITIIASQAEASNYLVKSDDTLYTIAKETGTSVSQLKQMNKLKSNEIIPGQKIKVTLADYYRVKDDDTVQSIAKQFKITPFEVRFWNRLESNTLTPGKKLIVSEYAYRKVRDKKNVSGRVAPALSPDSVQFLNQLQQEANAQSFDNEPLDRNEIKIDLSNTEETAQEETTSNQTDEYTTSNYLEDSSDSTKAEDEVIPASFVSENNDVARIAHQIAKGKIYIYGANSAHAVDCSAFAQQVLAALGKEIPRTTYAQMAVGQKVSTPKPGDLVFFNDGSHVGVYIGDGKMVDALNPKAGVGERAVNYINGTVTGYYRY